MFWILNRRYRAIPIRQKSENSVMDEPNESLTTLKALNEVPIRIRNSFSAIFRKSDQGILKFYYNIKNFGPIIVYISIYILFRHEQSSFIIK